MEAAPLGGLFHSTSRSPLQAVLAAPTMPSGTLRAPTLTEIKTEKPCLRQTDRGMAHIIFKCPRTGLNVQHWLAEDAAPGDPHASHDTVVCQACSGLHFINRSSGKLLGETSEE
jgi:hypothetical protein